MSMIQYRNFADLNATIVNALPSLPRDIGLIVGIPSSGMLAANLLALHLSIPFTDLDGFLSRRVLSIGLSKKRYFGASLDDILESVKRVLIIDDSVATGTEMRLTRNRISESGLPYEILYAAVYVTPEGRPLVDFAFEELDWGRCFEWNVMNHSILESSCVDFDGVLCVDPSSDENDDGEKYEFFLQNAKPLFLPKREVRWVVTGRLEKYRALSEDWLKRHGVRYSNLVMLDLPDKKARLRSGIAPFKAETYLKTGATLFIESEESQAFEIASRSGRPVLCMSNREMLYPDMLSRIPRMVQKAPRAPRSILNRLRSWVDKERRCRHNKAYMLEAQKDK